MLKFAASHEYSENIHKFFLNAAVSVVTILEDSPSDIDFDWIAL